MGWVGYWKKEEEEIGRGEGWVGRGEGEYGKGDDWEGLERMEYK
jgi:hypothetical protein